MTTSALSQDVKQTLKSLQSNWFDARLAQTAAEAKKIMLEMILPTYIVGVGGSATLRQMGILDELTRRGNEVVNPFLAELTQDPAKHDLFLQTCRKTLTTDVFLTGANAVTEDGKILSVDFSGNRVAGTIYGAPKVIITVGRNKIVKDADAALDRIRSVIAPVHAKRKARQTPCVTTGKCNDCNSPDRICSVTIIMERKPAHTDVSVIIVNEDLGLGWDPGWDEERLNKIQSRYLENTWAFTEELYLR